MNRRDRRVTVGAWCRAAAIAAGGFVACAPVASTSDGTAPENACPAFPCAGYSSSSAAACQAGACVVDAPSTSTGALILVVAVPTDALYAPGRSFALTLQQLLASTATDGCPLADCCVPGCALLPPIEIVNRSYVIAPSLETSSGVDFYLGNSGDIALPVQATYQPLWEGPSGQVFATSLGLPLGPIQAFAFASAFPTGFLGPGPAPGGPIIVVQTYLQDGMTYQLTDQPDAPFSAAYPPEVVPFTASGIEVGIASPTLQFDLTTETGTSTPTIPTFDISRAAGLDGWTAYLRDAKNLNTVSNVVTLSGTETPKVELATNRFPNMAVDALTGAQLVIAPPAGVVAPTEILAPAGDELPAVEQYPVMPSPVTVAGDVTWLLEAEGGVSAGPAPADLVFEATNVLVGGVETMSNFTYSARASAAVDATSGKSTFSVQLPPGQYLVIARPASGAPASSAVTLTSLLVPQSGPPAQSVTLGTTQAVTGTVVTADRRPVSQATIEAIPTACAPLPTALFASPFLATIECLPRAAQTTTASDGSFALALDPGQYLLRARPAEGTRFPWITQNLSVTTDAVALTPMVVPVPVGLGMRLVDPNDNPVVQAVVSMYSLPPGSSQAIELGSALTDDNGQYEMFVALPQP